MAQQQTTSGIKILSVVWFKVLPPEYGGQKAVALFNEYLSQRISLVCLCSKNNEVIPTTYAINNSLPVNKAQFLNPFVWRKIYSIAKQERVTHIILEFPYHAIAGFICKRLLKIKLVINTHNIGFLRFKEQKKWWSRLLFHFEKWAFKKADVIFLKTVEDRELAHQFCKLKGNSEVIPYGVKEQNVLSKTDAQLIIRKRHQLTEDEKIILFAGTLDYQPNADAVMAIADKLIPLLNSREFFYKIIVCGRNRIKGFEYLNEIVNPNLIIAGEVADIENYFAAANVFTCPVITGGGVQTKIIDALSFHLNVVCFENKTAGITNSGNKIFIAIEDNWSEFADLIMKASLTNEPTPSSFFEEHNWRSIAAKAANAIHSI